MNYQSISVNIRGRYIPIRNLLIILGICSLALVLRLKNLAAQSLRYDETFTVLVAQLPFKLGIDALLVDGVHPPLFYWVEKAFLIFGTSELVVRLPAVIFGSLGIAAVYLFTNEWMERRTGLLAGLLLIFSPFHLWYSQDARMYSMLAFFAIVCMWWYVRVLIKPGPLNYVIFTVASALAYLTHYFALFLPLIQFIYLVINLRKYPRQLRIWTGLQALAGVPLLVWVYLLTQRELQAFGIGWIPQPGAEDLLYTLINFTIAYIPPLSLFDWIVAMGISFLAAWGVVKSREVGSLTTLLALWAILPTIFTLILSTRRATYLDRFFILSLPAFVILIARGVMRLGKRWWLIISAALLLIVSWRVDMILDLPDTLKKDEWREVAQYLEANATKNEVIIPRVMQVSIPLRYYLETDFPQEAMEINRKVKSLQEIVKGYSGVWLVYWNEIRLMPAHELATQAWFEPVQETDPIAMTWIAGEGPELLDRKEFKGITLFHFKLEGDTSTQNWIKESNN